MKIRLLIIENSLEYYYGKGLIINKVYKYIDRYGLKISSIKKVDLRKSYIQYLCNEVLDSILMIDGVVDRNMLNSPHFELANLYFSNGEKWLVSNYIGTKYHKFKSKVLNREDGLPIRKLRVFDSIKQGYLKKGNEENYIVLLNKPLIETRYGIKSLNLKSPEIFMGHHRSAALLALGINEAKVIIAEDINKGSCDFYGKISKNYKELL